MVIIIDETLQQLVPINPTMTAHCMLATGYSNCHIFQGVVYKKMGFTPHILSTLLKRYATHERFRNFNLLTCLI